MSYSANDPDDLVHKKIDLNHIKNMSSHMHVPDVITVGPSRSAAPRINLDNGQLPVRMEVPNTIRIAAHDYTAISKNPDILFNTESGLNIEPTTPNSSDVGPLSEYDFPTIDKLDNNQPVNAAESFHMEAFTEINDKNVLHELQLLQNRINRLEKTFAKRDVRDRFVYSFIIGYIILQALFSVRRSMFN